MKQYILLLLGVFGLVAFGPTESKAQVTVSVAPRYSERDSRYSERDYYHHHHQYNYNHEHAYRHNEHYYRSHRWHDDD